MVAAYEAVCTGAADKLAKGEEGVVCVVSPTRRQSRVVKNYVRSIFEAPLLSQELVAEDREGFQLRNNIRIEILTGDFRSVRNFTIVCAIVDESCFFGVAEESKIRSDSELVRALKPALATTDGRIILISSPYAKKGYSYNLWKRNHGNDKGRALVWQAPSRRMNPTLPAHVVEAAMEEDRAAALAEYMAQWRDDVAGYIDVEAVESLVVPGRVEAFRDVSREYSAFYDASGGRSDSAALAIAHVESDGNEKEGKLVLDLLREWTAPHSPPRVIREAASILIDWKIRSVTADRYSAEFAASAFRTMGIGFNPSEKSKSEIYTEFLPWISGGRVELLNNQRLIQQLSNLERRTRSGGRDVVDHVAGGHDDVANAAIGALLNAVAPQGARCGVWGSDIWRGGDRVNSFISSLLAQE